MDALDLVELAGIGAVGEDDPRFVYFPMPAGKEQRSEIVCAYRKNESKPIILKLASALEELDLKIGNT